MLVHVAPRATGIASPDFVLGAVAVREAEERAMKSAAGEREAGAELIEGILNSGMASTLLAVARDREVADSASVSRCFEGLYMRLRVLLESGLRPAGDWPSLFFRVSPDQLDEAERGVAAAASRYGEAKLAFVAADSPGSAGGRIATGIADTVAGSYVGEQLPRLVSQILWNGERPSGWIHYTLNRDCECTGCRAAWSAVTPAPKQAVQGSPSPDVLIERANLPKAVRMSLRSAGIRTLTQVEKMRDADLLRVRNVGKTHIRMLRAAVERYRAAKP